LKDAIQHWKNCENNTLQSLFLGLHHPPPAFLVILVNDQIGNGSKIKM
jgi:hypothetical protein